MKSILKTFVKVILASIVISWACWMMIYSFTFSNYPDWCGYFAGSSFVIYLTIICDKKARENIIKFMQS